MAVKNSVSILSMDAFAKLVQSVPQKNAFAANIIEIVTLIDVSIAVLMAKIVRIWKSLRKCSGD